MKLNKRLELNNFEIYRIQLKESKIRKLKWISLKLRRCILHFSISFNYVPFHWKMKKKKEKDYPFLWNENLLFIFFPNQKNSYVQKYFIFLNFQFSNLQVRNLK